MGFNPKIHHLRSIHLKGYDYSQPGLYFVTICIQNRQWFKTMTTNEHIRGVKSLGWQRFNGKL